jgi:hypothetical protein
MSNAPILNLKKSPSSIKFETVNDGIAFDSKCNVQSNMSDVNDDHKRFTFSGGPQPATNV